MIRSKYVTKLEPSVELDSVNISLIQKLKSSRELLKDNTAIDTSISEQLQDLNGGIDLCDNQDKTSGWKNKKVSAMSFSEKYLKCFTSHYKQNDEFKELCISQLETNDDDLSSMVDEFMNSSCDFPIELSRSTYKKMKKFCKLPQIHPIKSEDKRSSPEYNFFLSPQNYHLYNY